MRIATIIGFRRQCLRKRHLLVWVVVTMCIGLVSGAIGENDSVVVYEDDSGFEESPRRSEQAKYALELEGEKAVTLYFKFPDHTQDEPLAVYGIDVSHHNGEIDWGKVPKNNVIFAVAKATEGTGFRDRLFKQHWAELKKHRDAAAASGNPGFFRGAYHFFTPSDPQKQARAFIEAVGTIEPGDLPPTLDIEWTSFKNDRWKRYKGSEIARHALMWLREIEAHYGRKPIIYTNAAWWNDHRKINNAELAEYPLWIANYSGSAIKIARPNRFPASFKNWTIWQFTDKGFFTEQPKKRFDVNRLNGGIEDLYTLVGLTEVPFKRGIRAPEKVKWLQDQLVTLGLMDMVAIGQGYGTFGPLTEKAVVDFQTQHGLHPSGIVDEATTASLRRQVSIHRQEGRRRQVLKESPPPAHCVFDSLETATVTQDQRKLALVVGVGNFASPDITPLHFTTVDARRFYDALIERWGFPQENVCLLLNEEATIRSVRSNFRKMTALIQKRDNVDDNQKDVAVFYASTHGSQAKNAPEDQADFDAEVTGHDSTLLLYDSWVEGTWDLIDDELDGFVDELYAKTPNVAVLLDSCHSGSMTKGQGLGQVKAVMSRPPGFEQSPSSKRRVSEAVIREKVVYLSAAQDDQAARELDALGHGIFTEALLRLSAPIPTEPMTYEKLKVLIENDMHINNREQIPVLTGPGNRILFASETRTRPGNVLRVQEIEPKIRLRGNPMPGLGAGALFNVFDDSVTGLQTNDPSLVKALLKITRISGGEALAEVVGQPNEENGKLEPGDFAVLMQPSDTYQALRIRLRPEVEPDGLPAALVTKVGLKVGQMSKGAMGLITLVDDEADFEVALLPEDDSNAFAASGLQRIVIRGSNLDQEIVVDQDTLQDNTVDLLVAKLQSLNLQKKYLKLAGYGGEDFSDNHSLEVTLVRSEQNLPPKNRQDIASQGVQCKGSLPSPTMKDGKYQLPVCTMYRVKVTYNAPEDLAAKRLHIGLVILGSNGDVTGYPVGEQPAVLKPGQHLYFPRNDYSFVAYPPIRAEDVFVVIGTQDRRDWHQITTDAKAAGIAAHDKPLEESLKTWTVTKVIAQLLDPNTMGQGVPSDQ